MDRFRFAPSILGNRARMSNRASRAGKPSPAHTRPQAITREQISNLPGPWPNTHVIAVGGPLSNKLNRPLLHAAPFLSENRPRVPLYVRIDFDVKETVSRKFNGRTHVRPQWSIYNAREDKYLYPHVDQDGWLTRDYLLFSCLPYTKSRVHVSAFGLYGPGVMALSLLVGGREKALEEALDQRAGAVYFQSLFAVCRCVLSGRTRCQAEVAVP